MSNCISLESHLLTLCYSQNLQLSHNVYCTSSLELSYIIARSVTTWTARCAGATNTHTLIKHLNCYSNWPPCHYLRFLLAQTGHGVLDVNLVTQYRNHMRFTMFLIGFSLSSISLLIIARDLFWAIEWKLEMDRIWKFETNRSWPDNWPLHSAILIINCKNVVCKNIEKMSQGLQFNRYQTTLHVRVTRYSSIMFHGKVG